MEIVKEEAHAFMTLTSVKGLGRIVWARKLSFKLLWIIGVLGLGTLCSLFTTELVRQYISYAKSTTVYTTSYKYEDGKRIAEEYIPSITVCNQYPFQSQPPKGINITGKAEFDELVRRTLGPNVSTSRYDKHENYFYHIGLEGGKQLGHKLENILIKCTFGRRHTFGYKWYPCLEHGSVLHFPVPLFFNCYVIDYANDKQHNYPVSIMELILYMDNFDRENDSQSEFNGIPLFFHKKDTFSFDDVVNILPGQKVLVDLSYLYTEELPEPYGRCAEDPKAGPILALNGRKLKYSKIGCQYAIYQSNKFYCCGCVNENFPIVGFEFEDFRNVTSCRKIGENYIFPYKCKKEERCHNPTHKYDDVCPDPCKYVNYHLSVASFPWPQTKSVRSFYANHIAGKEFEHRFKPHHRLYELIIENFARVQILFEIDEIVTYKDVPQLTFTSFISALGGLLNLYSGISFIIIIEIADFLLSTCYKCLKCKMTLTKVTDITKGPSVQTELC